MIYYKNKRIKDHLYGKKQVFSLNRIIPLGLFFNNHFQIDRFIAS